MKSVLIHVRRHKISLVTRLEKALATFNQKSPNLQVGFDSDRKSSYYAGRRSKSAPVKSFRFSELFLVILLSEFRFTVFFLLGCGVDSWIPPLQFFQIAKGKAPKEAWGGHLSGGGINVTFLRPHEPQLSAMCCVTLNQIDPSYMICVRSFVVLCPHYSTLSSPLPFRFEKISRKGRVFRSFVSSGSSPSA